MRKTCLICCRKHLCQAMILLMEARKNPELYGWHKYIALGHMAEAEDETIEKEPYLSTVIRDKRIAIEDGLVECSEWFEKMIEELAVMIEKEEKS
jgi:hypothetical protein